MTRRISTPGRRYAPGARVSAKGSYKVTYVKSNGERFQRTFTTIEARDKFIVSAKKKHWKVS